MMRAWVVVLGDFGRSPRMMYHTLSLSQQQQPACTVHVIATGGAAPLQQLTQAPNVHFSLLRPLPPSLGRLPRLLFLALKVIHQLLQLLWLMLVCLPRPDLILMQNPPAIPTMAVCWLAAVWHRACMVIDWHNFGYTIMGLSLGPRHWLVRLARSLEVVWGRQGHVHLCVTAAMQQELQRKWGIPATVLYDRPPSLFQRTDAPAAHDLFCRIAPELQDPSYQDFMSTWYKVHQQEAAKGTCTIATRSLAIGCGAHTSKSTGLSEGSDIMGNASATEQQQQQQQQQQQRDTYVASSAVSNLTAVWREGRPAIVVSSTSWTPDEDFGMLLDAACMYDRHALQPQLASSLPDVLFLITGKGPQRDAYLSRIRSLPFKRVAFRALWLEAPDYPKLLGSADIGVSLHSSSSGLDLPMKVVDMFGCGLPVCALAYSCISELVTDGKTGLLFGSARTLADHLAALLHGFGTQAPSSLLQHIREAVQREQNLRWQQNWQEVAWPKLCSASRRRHT